MVPTGILTVTYGSRAFHPYGEDLLLYNYTTKQTYRLATAPDAAAYARSPDATAAAACPLGYLGHGVPLLPHDAPYQQLEHELFNHRLWGVLPMPHTPPMPEVTRLAALPESTEGFLDVVGTEVVPRPQQAPIVVSSGDPIPISGWAVDRPGGGPAGEVFVVVDDQILASAEYGGERPDIAAYLGEGYRQSGFAADVPTEALSPGPHTLELWVLTQDQRGYYPPYRGCRSNSRSRRAIPAPTQSHGAVPGDE
jgi:hypothetical protein